MDIPSNFPHTATTRFGRRARGPALATRPPRRVDGPKKQVTAAAADAAPRMRKTAYPRRLVRVGSSESARPSRLVRVGSSSRARRPDTRPRTTAERHLASTMAGRGGGGQLRAASGASGVRVLDGDQDGGAPGELLLAVAHAAARRARDGRRGAQARRPYGATSFGGKRLKSSRRVGKCQVCSCCMSFALEFCDAESRGGSRGKSGLPSSAAKLCEKWKEGSWSACGEQNRGPGRTGR